MGGFLSCKAKIRAAANFDLEASGEKDEARPREKAVNTTAANTLWIHAAPARKGGGGREGGEEGREGGGGGGGGGEGGEGGRERGEDKEEKGKRRIMGE